jgi:hypothetical protein
LLKNKDYLQFFEEFEFPLDPEFLPELFGLLLELEPLPSLLAL